MGSDAYDQQFKSLVERGLGGGCVLGHGDR